MKVSPKSDYPIRVIRQAQEELPQQRDLYIGIYAMFLNHEVQVAFVPDVSAEGPPWDVATQLPGNVDELTSADQARVATILLNTYVVTPNATRAGTTERVPDLSGPDGESSDIIVFYVASEEFDRYAADLERLADLVPSVPSARSVSDLRGFEVIQFLDRRVVASGLLRPYDAMMLGRGSESGGR